MTKEVQEEEALNMKKLKENDLRILSEMGQDILSSLNLHDVILKSYQHLNQLMEAGIFAIALYSKRKDGLKLFGIDTNNSVKKGFLPMKNEYYWVIYSFNNQQEISSNRLGQHEPRHFTKQLFDVEPDKRQSFIYMPLTIKEERLGVITVQNPEKNAYSDYEVNPFRTKKHPCPGV